MKQEKLEELLASLSIEEKIGQLVQLNGNFFHSQEKIATGPAAKLGIDETKIYRSGSILNTFGAKALKDVQTRYLEKSEKKIPMLFMADIINGYQTVFPISLGLGSSFDPEMVKKTAEVAAHEAAVTGVHVTFSPMVDMVRDARWGRVMESYGEDNYLNCAYAKAMVEGYQGKNDPKRNIAACVKHFAAYGAPVAGREYSAVEMGERTLRESYLPSYKAAVDAGCRLVMTSFNTIDGIPVTGNPWMLRKILREEWGFDGTVISDHSAIKELIPHGVAEDGEAAAILALKAGCDIDMMTSTYANHLQRAIEAGKVEERYLDEACMNVLKLKNELGLFENPYRGADEAAEEKVLLCEEHRQFAREVVSKSCILLENKGHVLPLSKDKKVALIGPYADYSGIFGMWSFTTKPEMVVTVKQGFLNQVSEEKITWAKGCGFMDQEGEMPNFGAMVLKMTCDDPEKEIEAAKNAAKESDVIVLALGEHAQQSGEGGARGTLTLADCQMKLLKEMKKLKKPIVVLVFSGRPLELKDVAKDADAILQCWFPGIEGGNGIADLLYGHANPSARCSMSFPYVVGQCPIYYNELSSGRPAKTSTHSTRFTSRYIDIPNSPQYCFGYGLSYSTFTYDKLTLDTDTLTSASTLHASVELSNESEVAGSEIVQLYIRDLVGCVARPIKELKGVQHIFLNPHEKKTVTFEIKETDLRFVRADMSLGSEVGEFHLFIGGNSQDVLQTTFKLI